MKPMSRFFCGLALTLAPVIVALPAQADVPPVQESQAAPSKSGADQHSKPKADAEEKRSLFARWFRGEKFERDGRYAEALAEYLEVLNEAEERKPDKDTALQYESWAAIAKLGKKYAPAWSLIVKRLAEASEAICRGKADSVTVTIYGSINSSLDRNAETLKVYDRIRATQKSTARGLFMFIQPLLVERQRYAEVVAGIGNPKRVVDEYIKIMTELKAVSNLGSYSAEDVYKQDALAYCADIYEALLGVNRLADAKAVQGSILKFAPLQSTIDELARRAFRAGKDNVAKEFKTTAKVNPPTREVV